MKNPYLMLSICVSVVILNLFFLYDEFDILNTISLFLASLGAFILIQQIKESKK